MHPYHLVFLLATSLLRDAVAAPAQVPFNMSVADPETIRPRRKLQGRFLHITDMHPDPHYRVGMSEKSACHRKKPKKAKERSGEFGMPYSECDSPFALTNYTLDYLEHEWASDIDFVVWTGDSARHDNDRKLPRTTKEIYGLNRAVSRKMEAAFSSKGIPVIPSIAHNIMMPGPNDVTFEFSSIWRSFIPFPSYQVFQRGGYYSVEVIPDSLAVVWLSGHVPPSASNYFPDCHVRYVELSLRFQDTIVGHLFGHMNADHFFFLDGEVVTKANSNRSTVLDDSVGTLRKKKDLYGTLLKDFAHMHKGVKKVDHDNYAVVNVAPSVVPNPYLPSFRIFSYNISGPAYLPGQHGDTGTSEEQDLTEGDLQGNTSLEAISCVSDEAFQNTQRCRNVKPWNSSPKSPSRRNTLWSPLGYAQYFLPNSSQGALMRNPAAIPSTEDLYRASFHPSTIAYQGDHNRHSSDASHSSAYTLASTDLSSPADSPPNHNLSNPALKSHLRQSHIRARLAASPYPRDTESVHSSSSETEELVYYTTTNPNGFVDSIMYSADPQVFGGMPQAMAPAGPFGRMHHGANDALEKMAASVRAATTTSASDRAKQIFVQAWLTANYSPYPDGNVPRQGLYLSYRRVCDQYNIPHINTATLGKAIRLCFPTIKTRRLGVRGNSKYHYCGIRPATTEENAFLADYIRSTNNAAAHNNNNNANKAANSPEGGGRGEDGSDEEGEEESDGQSSGNASKRNSLNLSNMKQQVVFADEKTPTAASLLSQAQATQRPPSTGFPAQAPIRRQPGAPENASMPIPPHASPSGGAGPSLPPNFVPVNQGLSIRRLPQFPSIEEAVGTGSTTPQSIAAREVWEWFTDHLDTLMEVIRAFRFDQFEMHIRNFWSQLSGPHREVVHAPAVAGLMAKADAIVYDMLSVIPPASVGALRGLADKMEKILLVALENFGTTFVEPKVELGARFGHLVLRFLDIYQVTQALGTVLTNHKQLAEMQRSWQKVDFESVRNQSALVCNCRHEDLVQLLEVEFVSLLESLMKSTDPLQEVMAWADKCCERLIGGRGGPEDRSTMSSRSVLIRWGYVTSQVMRDLTIRSDPSFGAFQILKLFLDDWIALNVLRSVALSTNSVAASVEPVMQQQFLSLSPMAGQESFSQLDVRPQHIMNQTPTTSSMLAALQQDPFPSGSIDPSSFNNDAFGLSTYMDTSLQDDSIPVNSSGLSFPDYSTASFDVTTSYTPHDLGMSASGTPPSSSEPDSEPEGSKSDA
ncbi:hypothetical protein EUX98_g608 [Antrodiella citrinella]|uniref:RFX-type winged-helix domain-containing protein n=1 Tax=Antrodiella citrinella TaxID=2447956 RepID=A0A4S4N3L9_9APHY|nr:hypothetical protein EUX98_g608 [Antrodiella citrinella]